MMATTRPCTPSPAGKTTGTRNLSTAVTGRCYDQRVMHRLTSALLLGGGVLLASYISAPAAPTLEPPRASVAAVTEIDALAPLADDVAQETARLRARLAAVPAVPVARRDPFNFGAVRPERPTRPVTVSTADIAPVVEAAPAIAWPALVAVLTEGSDTPVFTAVLGVGDDIEMVKSGTAVGGFQVSDITSTSVELIHVATNTVTRLSIR